MRDNSSKNCDKNEVEKQNESMLFQFLQGSIDELQGCTEGITESNNDTDFINTVFQDILSGHKATIQRIAWSPDSRRLISASEDGTIRIWNIETRECIFEGNECNKAIEWSPDSKMVAYSYQDNKIKLWIPGSIEMSHNYIDLDFHIANGHITVSSSLGSSDNAEISIDIPKQYRLMLQLIRENKMSWDLSKEFGQGLYSWIFPIEIHGFLEKIEALANDRKAKLRLRLCIEDNSIANLPLEYLYRKKKGDFIAANPNIVLSRYLNVPLEPSYVRRQKGPLKMLTIIADPIDQNTRLDTEEWKDLIRKALFEPLNNKSIYLDFLDEASQGKVINSINKNYPNIIQFIGHGVYRNGKGYLAFVDEKTNKTRLIDDESFANFYMASRDYLGLISLATCESGRSDDPQSFMGIAPRLVQRGIPAVIAMQSNIHTETAKIFLKEFYGSISKGNPVDLAAQFARNAILTKSTTNNYEFATPVIYMRDKNGNIFQ
jgi:WD40 repeat protein